MTTRIDYEIRPLAEEEIGLLERYINFDWAASGKHRERFVKQQGGRVVYPVAWHENAPVGHALLQWDGSTDELIAPELDHCPDIEDLFVSPDYRSKGIGSQLLDFAESLARRERYSRIGLGVGIDNPQARSLYEHRGYRDSGLGEYVTGGRYIDRDGREESWEEICNYLIKQLN